MSGDTGLTDDPTARIASYVDRLRFADLSSAAVEAVVARVLDTLGCAIAAFDGEPCAIARHLAGGATSNPGSSIIGLESRSTPELAAFANGTMARYLDFNDTDFSASDGHPSDLIPALLAVGEATRASGAELVLGVHCAYEVWSALAGTVALGAFSWDYGLFLEVATAAGVAKILGLSAEQAAHAVALALTPNLPLGVRSAENLSHWKGCAGPYAAMAGTFAARMAQAGMTGPPRPFEGVRGLWTHALPRFELPQVGAPQNGSSAAQRTHIKLYPCSYEAQGPAFALIGLRKSGVRPQDVESLRIRTDHVGWYFTGGGSGDHDEKWNPPNREVADHSLPYVAAVALSDGAVDIRSFSDDRLHDPALRALLSRIVVEEDPAFTEMYAADHSGEFALDVVLGDGRTIELPGIRQPGHAKNPMTTDGLHEKFRANVRAGLDHEEQEELLKGLQALPRLENVDPITALLRRVRN